MQNERITEALERLHNDLNELAPAIEHVNRATEVTRVVSEIPSKHQELINELKSIDESFKQKLLKSLQNQATVVFAKNETLLNELQSCTTSEEELIKKLNSYTEEITNYTKKIDSVDFPSRLDKLDATVAGINQGLMNLQYRLDNTEREIRDQSRELSILIKESQKSLEESSLQRQKEIQFNKMLLIAIVAISIATIVTFAVL